MVVARRHSQDPLVLRQINFPSHLEEGAHALDLKTVWTQLPAAFAWQYQRIAAADERHVLHYDFVVTTAKLPPLEIEPPFGVAVSWDHHTATVAPSLHCGPSQGISSMDGSVSDIRFPAAFARALETSRAKHGAHAPIMAKLWRPTETGTS
jgi:hypothetical protein